MPQRTHFASRLGAILAAAGSAVGLGNIWRFPSEAGQNGGAAFILLYILCIAVIAVPVLIVEMATGRAARANVYDTFRRLGDAMTGSAGLRPATCLGDDVDDSRRMPEACAPGHNPSHVHRVIWRAAGMMCVAAGFLVFSYYSVVAGWTLHYTWEAATGRMLAPQDFTAGFAAFTASPWRPLGWMALFVALTTGIVVLGVRRGIERGSKLMMPALFVLLLVLAVCSLTRPGAWQGVEFLFKPDFSRITTSTALDALGQAFFTLSVGIGCIMTYASYFSSRVNIVKDAYTVALIDTLVAITAGLIIFPSALSVGVSPGAGPALVFITLPEVFVHAFGATPWLCYTVTLLFYLLLVMAALTSSISMLEITTAFAAEKSGRSRLVVALILGLVTLVSGTACSLSFGPWQSVTIFGLGFFDLADFLVAKLAMPIGAIFMCLLMRRCGQKRVTAMLTNGGTLRLGRFPTLFYQLVTWVIPIAIVIIFINELL